ncbi:MAG: ABC transporter ATP-binding protein [Planctomycetes bacterium]|nr:ABC transporter ATP-binding protein [Planctomycetota bacterium]
MKELATLLPFIRPYRRTLAWGLALLVLSTLIAGAQPLVLRRGIDALARLPPAPRVVASSAALLLGLAALRWLLQVVFRHALFGVTRRVEHDLRNAVFRAVLRLDAAFFGRMPTGDLLSRATNDLDAVRNLLGFGLLSAANTLLLGALAIVGMVWIAPPLAAVAVLPLGLLTLVMKRQAREIHRASKEVQEQLGRVATRAQERIAGVRVVKAFAQEGAEVAAFRELNRETFAKNLELVKVSGLGYTAMGLIAELGVLGTLVVGGLGMQAGRYTAGDFMGFLAYQLMLVWPMVALGWVLNMVQRAAASMGRANEILRAEPEVRDAPGASEPGEVRGELEVRGLTFRYPAAARDALTGVTLRVPAGGRLGVVGRTGAGKSTLLGLFARLYRVPDGTVFLDGKDVNALAVAGLRAHIGYVPQDAFLFSDRMKSNIAYGRREEVLEEVAAAARLSRLDGEIESFPEKYEQLIGERGVTLSGGQRQRATLARATILGPRVLLFDDVFANVDSRTEREILDGLEEFLKGRTVIVAGHRLAAVRRCDRIVVLDGGRVVEEGTHDELVARGGIYRDLWDRQRLAEELEALA